MYWLELSSNSWSASNQSLKTPNAQLEYFSGLLPFQTMPVLRDGIMASATAERSCMWLKIIDCIRSPEMGSFCLPMLITELLKNGISSRQSNRVKLSSCSSLYPLSKALVAPNRV